jgi:predicted small metal-binding protein
VARFYNISPRWNQGRAKAARRSSFAGHGEIDMVMKTVRCDCGFLVRSDDDDKLVAELQQHAHDDHHMNLSREQVLAMAQLEPGPQAPHGKT